ncbi:DUF2971 domain-containing protein [Leisingera sp. S132]|uniref:DUF2971 domain-containing protein n=1 Tax=Leisingera sp. S132 TaxID=2867016 RepID=UPI0021A61D89|nr:DUF2971 domain-containing protein [Leisingera sp. S132]UWQ77589.1 DUF2971 domain-containing protein [Leisingera sp. S132]
MPTTLWHYTTFEVLEKILETKSLLASDFRALNDSQEFKVGLQSIRDFLVDWGGRFSTIFGTTDQEIETALMDVEERLNGQVLCFSAAADDLSMWRGYSSLAHGGQSVAIGFSSVDLAELGGAYQFQGPSRCEYTPGASFLGELPHVLYEDSAQRHLELSRFLMEFTKLIKSPHFEVEAEYRMTCSGTVSAIGGSQFKLIGGEYRRELPLVLPDCEVFEGLSRPLAIDSIMTGPKTNHGKVERFLENYFRLERVDCPRVQKSQIPFI